jgi:hypothetical protein
VETPARVSTTHSSASTVASREIPAANSGAELDGRCLILNPPTTAFSSKETQVVLTVTSANSTTEDQGNAGGIPVADPSAHALSSDKTPANFSVREEENNRKRLAANSLAAPVLSSIKTAAYIAMRDLGRGGTSPSPSPIPSTTEPVLVSLGATVGIRPRKLECNSSNEPAPPAAFSPSSSEKPALTVLHELKSNMSEQSATCELSSHEKNVIIRSPEMKSDSSNFHDCLGQPLSYEMASQWSAGPVLQNYDDKKMSKELSDRPPQSPRLAAVEMAASQNSLDCENKNLIKEMLPRSSDPASHASRKEAASLNVVERGYTDSRLGDSGKLPDLTSPVPKMAPPPFRHVSHNNNNNKEDPEQMSQFMVEVSEETALCSAVPVNGNIKSSKEASLSPIPGQKFQREAAGGSKNSSETVCGKLLKSPARIETRTPSVGSCVSSSRWSSQSKAALGTAPPTDSGNGQNGTSEVPGRLVQPPASSEAAHRNATRQLIARLFESSSDEGSESEDAVLGTAVCPILVDCDSDMENPHRRSQPPASGFREAYIPYGTGTL